MICTAYNTGRVVMTRIPLRHTIKHLCQDSSPLQRHLSIAPQSTNELYSSLSFLTRGIIPSQNSLEAVAVTGSDTVPVAQASPSGDLCPS